MGMYTALSLGVCLKRDTPEEVAVLLEHMTGQRYLPEDQPNYLCNIIRGVANTAGCTIRDAEKLVDHPLFHEANRCFLMLRCDSYYFDFKTNMRLQRDDIISGYYLSGTSNLKNYDGEIKLFLDWLSPYVDTTGFVGWTMYEEDYTPTILWKFIEGGIGPYETAQDSAQAVAEEALREIACLEDKTANHHLRSRGSYAAFDEPASVETARAALTTIINIKCGINQET